MAQYDFDGANQRVNEFYASFHGKLPEETMLPVDWHQAFDINEEQITCKPYGDPPSYRFAAAATQGDDATPKTEITFRMIGIIDAVNLLPIQRRFIQQSRISRLEQRVMIHASQSEAFNDNLQALSGILDQVSSSAPLPTDTQMCLPNSPEGSLTFSNRVFSSKSYSHPQPLASITHMMDPLHVLRTTATKQDLVHTTDNVVEYLRFDGSGYASAPAGGFARGDIVEVHFGIVLFHSGVANLFAKLVLRSIVSLDQSFSQALRAIRPMNPAVVATLKRKYVADPVSRKRQVLGDVTNQHSQPKQGPANHAPHADVNMVENVRHVVDDLEDLAIEN
ncbi:hypothetical protein AURDEDRAFT_156666 [Auricularia subglabra TFB-10046 SS5]|nr:hypothetical protein AURDEDRAFT_156666 [Auricularia subglabra TFB-10046 SS5]